MPQTVTQERNPASVLDFVMEALTARGYLHHAGDLVEEPAERVLTEADDAEAQPRVRRSETSARAALANAMGDEYDDSAISFSPEPSGYSLYDAPTGDEDADVGWETIEEGIGRPEPSSEGRGDRDGQVPLYVARQGNWREAHGFPRQRKRVPPSRTPEGRRKSHLKKRAQELGISIEEAGYLIQHRAPKGSGYHHQPKKQLGGSPQ